ncbi:LysR family transcriptional regulator [Flexibacterium corallicola]|uniref:LysR family transcriptional regulator n=1 Tax=Flexibacterium corallicola TaxID=3037259 RepID=UPI00286F5931|nr:LysR family transcriptional regulator [Pseudovibrio sp. M1P-2-3]
MLSIRAADWEQLPYFLAAARTGSLRAAADLVHTNHGTVDRHIRALEALYKVQLFNRTRNGMSLTEAGEALLPMAEEAEILVLRAQRRLEGLDKTEAGTVRFSMPSILAHDVIAPILARFSEQYPEIDLEVRLTDRMENINRLETDVSLRVSYEVNEDVIARKLYQVVTGIYAHEDYIEKNFKNAGEGGEGLRWLGWGPLAPASTWIPGSPFPRAEESHSIEEGLMHLSMVRNKCGMTALPVIFEKLYPELQRVPGTPLTASRPIWILLHSDLRRTTRIRRFVDFLASELLKIKKDMQGELVP